MCAALVAAGIAVVGMNAWWTSEEMAYALEDSAPRAVILDAERLERLRGCPQLAGRHALIRHGGRN